MRTHPLWTLAAVLWLCHTAAAQLSSQTQGTLDPTPFSGPRLFCATSDDALTGAVIGLVDGRAPALEALAPTDGARLLRRFGRQLFAVNRSTGTIQRVPLDGGPAQLYALGAGSEPMDVLVAGAPSKAGEAWVSRRNDPQLLRLDLASGATTEVIDLSPVGGGDSIALGTMERHGSRLFVQVRVLAGQEVPVGDSGVLAVVDLERETLVDVDPVAPGVQGVALMGAPPRFKMQIINDTLFVSTTDSTNDAFGGIERVDLTTLQSVGYAISEANGHSDMGGFVMVDEQRGYYVFHTDLATSTHLVSFSIVDGPGPSSIIDLLGDTVDVLVYDPSMQRLYLPSGYLAGNPGLYVFSTETNALLGLPLPTGLRPHDALLMLQQAGYAPAP